MGKRLRISLKGKELLSRFDTAAKEWAVSLEKSGTDWSKRQVYTDCSSDLEKYIMQLEQKVVFYESIKDVQKAGKVKRGDVVDRVPGTVPVIKNIGQRVSDF